MNIIKYKFENCLVGIFQHFLNELALLGCLVGDCLGRDFEGEECPDMDNFNFQLSNIKKVQANHFEYTDDTALTRAVCESLIASYGLNIPDLAKSLITTYAKEPKRGYARGAISLFENLRFYLSKNKLNEYCFEPALSSFNGAGSFGNGSAMRISPIALHTLNKSEDEMIISVILSVHVTHAHYLAVIGGILQCYAIRFLLKSNMQQYINNSSDFLNYYFDCVINFIVSVEEKYNYFLTYAATNKIKNVCADMQFYVEIIKKHNSKFEFNLTDKNAFSDRLKLLKMLFNQCEKNGYRIELKEFHKKYAKCDITALESIPISLFAFMIATNPKCVAEVNSKLKVVNSFTIYDHFERVILYAISLGGDTDTIASMAGSIVGAFYEKQLSNSLHIFQSCAGYKDMCKYANDLFNLTNKTYISEVNQVDQIEETIDNDHQHKTMHNNNTSNNKNKVNTFEEDLPSTIQEFRICTLCGKHKKIKLNFDCGCKYCIYCYKNYEQNGNCECNNKS